MSITVKGKEYDNLTCEHRNGDVLVHGWSRYVGGSLDGQVMKCYIDSFKTVEEATSAYPEAEPSHVLMQEQNTFDHLPD